MGDKTKRTRYNLANIHNYLTNFLDDILLVEKRVFLWYDTENRFRTGKSENRTTIFVSLK